MRALVLFSGGQDSTTCLAWALSRYDHVETIGFAYGQRHEVELIARRRVLEGLRSGFPGWAQRLGEDHVLDLAEFGAISETALTREAAIEMTAAGLPSTFVPGRNLVFFTYAAALGYRRRIPVLVGGMCETDYSGYPDCRNETLQTLARALSLGLDWTVEIATPLMWIDKAGTWALAHELGGDRLVELIVEETHTCYLGDRSQRHAWGYGCGSCPACELRRKGWDQWQTAKS
ncbi:MAG: 7-cyano-7-deazaguanine synthase QueC [Pseudomonadota bacterium]|jgi:7-cyano-7-deazaguanine synthase|nr:MAG: 7-cyano-7-deazaguanine synthase QueC [Pseudomonadota bacterium]